MILMGPAGASCACRSMARNVTKHQGQRELTFLLTLTLIIHTDRCRQLFKQAVGNDRVDEMDHTVSGVDICPDDRCLVINPDA